MVWTEYTAPATDWWQILPSGLPLGIGDNIYTSRQGNTLLVNTPGYFGQIFACKTLADANTARIWVAGEWSNPIETQLQIDILGDYYVNQQTMSGIDMMEVNLPPIIANTLLIISVACRGVGTIKGIHILTAGLGGGWNIILPSTTTWFPM